MVHFVPHQSTISLIEGRTALLISPSALTEESREIRFYVQNSWDSLGIEKAAFFRPETGIGRLPVYRSRNMTLLVHHGKTVLLLRKLPRKTGWKIPVVIDFLIVSRNAVRTWDQIRGRVAARTIIFDDSNKTLLTDRLLEEARRLKIPCHSVRRQGAFIQRI